MKAFLRLGALSMLLLCFGTTLKAQDKYDYAIVKYISPIYIKPGLYISISGKGFERIEVKKDEVKDNTDYTPLLNYVHTMTGNGWKVINTITEANIISFILERKAAEGSK